MSLAARVLLLGAGGMLGTAWRRLLEARGLRFEVAGKNRVNLTDRSSIQGGIGDDVRTVINCAGWTEVDAAESHQAEARQINGAGVGWLAERCRELDALLVHYSTDYVFDGQATVPYPVQHERKPLNAYGRSKALGEELVEQSGCRHLLLRTSWLYAPWGSNFVRTIARLCRERDTLRVVNDQWGRPTSAEHLAKGSLTLAEREAQGTYHLSDGGTCTWFDFAREIVSHCRSSCRVEACSSAEFPSPAPRPAYSVLDLSRTEELLGPMPHWRIQLQQVLASLEKA